MAGRLFTLAEAVDALGLSSSRALHRLIENGAPKPADGDRGSARYDVAAIREWMDRRQTRQRPAMDLNAERAKLAKVQRQLTTLKLRETKGQLIAVKDAEMVSREIAGAVKAELLSVPRRAVLAGLPREYERLVRTLVVAALRELAGDKTVKALGERAKRGDDDIDEGFA